MREKTTEGNNRQLRATISLMKFPFLRNFDFPIPGFPSFPSKLPKPNRTMSATPTAPGIPPPSQKKVRVKKSLNKDEKAVANEVL